MRYFLNSVLCFVTLSCTESLPPRVDSPELLKAHIKAAYNLSPSFNGVSVSVTFINIFDETLEERLGIFGNVELMWDRIPQVKKVITLNSNNLSYAKNYNRITGELAIDPGDSVVISARWSVMADSEAQIRNQIFLFTFDRTCLYGRRIASSQTFTARGDARLFLNTVPISFGETKLTFCLVTNWIAPNSCPPPPACDP